MKSLPFRIDLALCAVMLLAAIFLTPILKTPLLGDDAFNSYLTGYMKYHGLNALQLMRIYDWRLIDQQGRWIPGTTIIQFTMWTLTQSAVTIKFVQVLAILSNLFLFYAFLIRFSRSRSIALWSTIIALMTFEIRDFYDPYAGIVVGMQVVMGTLLGAAILLVDEIDGGRPTRWRIPVAVTLYAIASLTYEISYLYIIAFFALAWMRRGNLGTALRIMIPFAAVFVILVAKDVYLRHNSHLAQMAAGVPIDSREYVLSLNPAVVLVTWFWQTAAAVPLIYLELDPRHYFPDIRSIVFRTSPVAPVLFILALGVCFGVLRSTTSPRVREGEREYVWQSIVIGVLFAVIPGALISISPRWQAEVLPGLAYLPVYHAGYGIAIVLGVAVAALLKNTGRARVIFGLALPFVAAFVLLITFQANALTLALYDPVWNWGRENLTQSLADGLLDRVPPDSAVFADTSYPFFYDTAFIWDSRYLMYLYSQKRVSVYPGTGINATSTLCTGQRRACIPTRPAFQLFNQPRDYRSGTDALVKVDRIVYQGGSGVAVGRDATVVERGPAAGNSPSAVSPALAERDFTLIASGPDWRRYQVRSACGPISASVFAGSGLVDVIYGSGFYARETGNGAEWHWAQRSAQFVISNSLGRREPIDLSFSAEELAPQPHRLTVRFNGRTIVRTFAGKPLDFHLHADLAPLGWLPVDFSTDAPKPAGLADPRDLHFRIVNERLTTRNSATDC